jgi:hypothetical protein
VASTRHVLGARGYQLGDRSLARFGGLRHASPARRLLASVLAVVLLTLGSVAGTLAAPPAPQPPATSDYDGDGLTYAWETQWGLNPNSRDSIGNGVRDGAEDYDNDGLSNLGEQLFHTNPVNPDSNGNGTLDGADDSDSNGVPDGLEQDKRAVPAGLRPSLANARRDRPAGYTDGCHTETFDATIHPCSYGTGSASRTIVAFGDSHAQQWMPALIAAALVHHWRVISLTKSACPGVHVTYQNPAFPGSESSCQTWRLRAESWLRKHPPTVIIISNTRGYRLMGPDGHVLAGTAFEDSWRKGLVKTLANLPRASSKVVLGDTPHMAADIPVCLQANLGDISACQSPRAKAWRVTHDDAEAAAAKQGGATFTSLSLTVCSYDPCPIVVNDMLMWRDAAHLTATYVAELAPAIAGIVSTTLASRRSADEPSADNLVQFRLQGGP